MLNVDGTALIQFVVVALFVVIMYFFFFKPMTHLIEARERHIQGTSQDAEQANERSSEILRTYISQIEAARGQGIDRMVEARRQVLEQQHLAVEAARQEAQRLVEESLVQVREAVTRSSASLRGQAQEMSRMIAGRILGRRVEA